MVVGDSFQSWSCDLKSSCCAGAITLNAMNCKPVAHTARMGAPGCPTVVRPTRQQRLAHPPRASGELITPSAPGPIQLGPDKLGQTSRRSLLKNALLLGAGIAACPCCTGEALASGNAKFDYGTLSGPINWGGTCSAGMRQSPINIPAKALRANAKLRATTGPATACRPAQIDVRGYKPVKPTILNTGVGTMQVGTLVQGWCAWPRQGLCTTGCRNSAGMFLAS